MPPRTKAFLLLVFLALPVFLYGARRPLLVAVARALTVDDAPARADYIIPLSGGADHRPSAAAELYRRGLAPRILIFSFSGDSEDAGPRLGQTQAEIYRGVLESDGVPAAAILLLPGRVDSTRDEALIVRRHLLTHPARRLIIVTSAEHTRRARWTFERILAGVPVEVRVSAARHAEFDETNWWKHDAGVLAYLHEFFKFAYYMIRDVLGGLGPREERGTGPALRASAVPAGDRSAP